MKRLLLLLGVAALFAAAPVSAQYIYLDVNGDGVCDMNDVLGPSVTSIDVYLDSNHDHTGALETCWDGVTDQDFFTYEFILRASGGGTVTYGAFTDATGFGILLFTPEYGSAGTDFWTGRANTTALPSSGGPYKLGSLAVTVTGNPVLGFAETTAGNVNAFTVMGSNCVNPDTFDPTWVWGQPYWPADDACGTAPTTANERPTTWGEIKNLYK